MRAWFSGRRLVSGMGAVPFVPATTAPNAIEADPVLFLCKRYGELSRQGDELLHQWSDCEDWLVKHRGWLGLGPEEQRALPEARALDALDAEYNQMTRTQAALLRRLRRIEARTLAGVVGKLRIVAEAIEPEDYPSEHRLLQSAIADLRVLKAKRSKCAAGA